MSEPSYLQVQVNTALDNAEENGFFDDGASLSKMDANGIATDLIEYEADLGDYDFENYPEPLIAAVQEWLNRYSRRISIARGEFS